jgi:hypothetical protein
MNFFTPTTPLEIWTGLPAFIFTIGLIVITPVAMFTWIRRRGWWS